MQHEQISLKQVSVPDAKPAAPRKSGHGIRWFLVIPIVLAIVGGISLLVRTRSSKALAATTQSMEAEPVTVTHPQVSKPDNELLLPSTLQAYSDSPNVLNYELDVWERVRRSLEAARASEQASEADLRFVRLGVEATTAIDYYQRRESDQEIAVIDRVVEDLRQAVGLTTVRLPARPQQ